MCLSSQGGARTWCSRMAILNPQRRSTKDRKSTAYEIHHAASRQTKTADVLLRTRRQSAWDGTRRAVDERAVAMAAICHFIQHLPNVVEETVCAIDECPCDGMQAASACIIATHLRRRVRRWECDITPPWERIRRSSWWRGQRWRRTGWRGEAKNFDAPESFF